MGKVRGCKTHPLSARGGDSYRRCLCCRMLTFARNRAKKKHLPCTLTDEWVDERIQAGVCELSGLPFVFEREGPFQPSIHRVDCSRGYTPENCVMVLWIVNSAIGPYRTEDLLYVAHALARRHHGTPFR